MTLFNLNTNIRTLFFLWIASVLPIAGSFATTSWRTASPEIRVQQSSSSASSHVVVRSSSSSSTLYSSVDLEETTTTTSSTTNIKTNDNAYDDDILSAVFGSLQRRNDFLRDDLGRNIVRLHRQDLELASPLDRLRMNDLYDDLGESTVLRKRGSSEFLNKTAMPTFGDLEAYIATGGSAVVAMPPSLETCTDTFKTLLQFKESVESALERPTSINVYHSGPSAVALNRHYDSYDVIVIQLDGEKEWEIQLPAHYVDGAEEGIWTNTTLKPGDILYLPQGVWHAATTVEGFASTTHATIGLLDPK
jgi:hypothetical protein